MELFSLTNHTEKWRNIKNRKSGFMKEKFFVLAKWIFRLQDFKIVWTAKIKKEVVS